MIKPKLKEFLKMSKVEFYNYRCKISYKSYLKIIKIRYQKEYVEIRIIKI